MSRVGGKRDENKKKDRCVHVMKLCGGENDERFEKIETSRDRCATAAKNFVGDKPGNEGSRRMRQTGSKKQPVEIAPIGNRRDALPARSAGTTDQGIGAP